jgi:hypothetical protein
MKRITVWFFFVFSFVIPSVSIAQVDTGTIVGTVLDKSGAVVPNATVTLTEVQTNIKTIVKSDAEGNYIATPLKVGNYSISVAIAGFKTQTRENVVLRVQDRLRADFELQVGEVTEKILVTEEVPLVQTETSSLGEVIDSRQITDLPLNGRNYTQLATLTTGVARTSEGNNGNVGGDFVANGTRGDLNNFILDGIDNNSNDNGGVILRTNVDAIQEFKVQTSTYSAELGRSGGAVINATIKSGTNQFHGSAFEFLRNSALDARGFFEDPTQPKAPFKRNEFGGVFGGPLKKDKTFFFGDYQGTRLRSGLNFVSSVPLPEQRFGDFSGLDNNTIYDPLTYDPATNTRLPFPGNIIPQDRIVPLSQAFMNLYPDPNQPGKLRNNYIISPQQTDGIDQFDVRVDHNFSATNQIFGRFSFSTRTRVNPAPLPALANGGNSSTGDTFEDTRGAALGNTHTFSPTMVNELRVGFNRAHVRRGLPVGGANFPPEELQVPGVANNPSTNGLTLFAPNGFRRLGDPAFAPTLIVSQEFQLSDSLNIIRGKHTLKVGVQLRRSQFNLFQVANPRGRFGFSGQFTRNPADPDGTGDPLADMLLGLPNFATISTLTDFGNRQHVYGGFVQDDFKINPSLTLNLGLRYEYTTPIFESHDRQSNFDFATGQLLIANQNGNSRGLVETDKTNFAPRVGFAFSPFQDHKTSFRGAYGIFYSAQEIRTGDPLQLAYNLPFFYEPNFFSDGITPNLTVAGGFPVLNVNQAEFPGVTSADGHAHTPYFQQWNLTIQRELPGTILLETGYVGSKGTHLQVLTDRNQVPVPGPGDVQERRPYPLYGSFTSIENHGNSTYHSFQLKATKRLSKGLSFLSAFTLSKAINDQPEICCSFPWPQNTYDLRSEKGLSDFDQRLRWVTSFDYQLPFGKGRPYLNSGRAVDLVLGGWHLGGIVSFGSGFPFTPALGFDPSNTGSLGLIRANRVGNGNLPSSQRTPDNWFDLNAFTIPADFTFGNAGKNILEGPGSKIADLSIRKQFVFQESKRLEFRAEFFNAVNHPYFVQPDNFIDDGPGAAATITDTAIPMRQIQFGLKFLF